MTIAVRILGLLLFLRLLAPPGICICKLSAPVFACLSGQDCPAETEEGDDDHSPGCPCSPFAAGMGLRAPSEPAPAPDLSIEPAPCHLPALALQGWHAPPVDVPLHFRHP